jgi:hypothetical protein
MTMTMMDVMTSSYDIVSYWLEKRESTLSMLGFWEVRMWRMVQGVWMTVQAAQVMA